MDELRAWVALIIQSEKLALNYLQEHGIVSDNCVTLGEIASTDTARALVFLRTNWHLRYYQNQ